ncbi:MAG: TonB family protein [Giesbergeria sp.]|nr:TonB family protein [Giesbergeria sp.]
MTAMTLPVPGGHLMRRDWLVSMVLHGALLGGVFWLAAVPVPQVQRLDVALRWAAPEPVPQDPPQVEPIPVAPPPMQVPRVRPIEPQRPKVQAPKPRPQAPAEVFDSAPLQSEPAVALPTAPVAPAAAPVQAAPEAVASTPPAPRAPTVADDQAYQQWRTRLEQALLQSKRYPTGARRMGQTGTVVVHLRIAADGSLLHCMLHHSSGFKVLDQAAEQLVRSVAQSLGAQVPPGRSADLRIPIVYELTES